MEKLQETLIERIAEIVKAARTQDTQLLDTLCRLLGTVSNCLHNDKD